MCQPGRPRPHGLSQPGRSASDGFQRTKSAGSRLYGATSTRAPADHVLTRTSRQTAVRIIGRDVEQHVAFGAVRAAGVNQALDHLDDRPDVRRRPRFDHGRQHVERRHVTVIDVRVARRHDVDRHALLARRLIDLVVDVRDVAGVDDVRIVPHQHPVQHVIDDGGPGIADVRRVVNRWSACGTSSRAPDRAARIAPCGGTVSCISRGSYRMLSIIGERAGIICRRRGGGTRACRPRRPRSNKLPGDRA